MRAEIEQQVADIKQSLELLRRRLTMINRFANSKLNALAEDPTFGMIRSTLNL